MFAIIRNKKEKLNTPIPKVINEINISKLKSGNYKFRIHDLGTNQKRYCKVKID